MAKYHFTSVVSKDHLFRMIAMYSSLKIRCSNFQLFVLCMDKETYEILSKINFESITVFSLAQVEDDELLKAKSNRSFHEYCWTSKASFLYYILKNYSSATYYAHLDADLYFYSDPSMIFEENPTASLYLTHHRNSKAFEFTYQLTGIYNTGFVGCRNDSIALAAISQWKERCLQHCSMAIDVDNKTFGDQRYVEDWPDNFKNVHIVNSLGVNAALWNIQDYRVTLQGGRIYVNHNPLIFYHFSGLSIISPREFNLCWYYAIEDPITLNFIYIPYVSILGEAIKEMRKNFPWFNYGFVKRENTSNTHYFILK